MKRYLILLCCCLPFVGSGQIITTIAGNGTFGYSADGVPALSAAMKSPYAIIIDDTGSLYYADMCNSRIRIIDTFGMMGLSAGNGLNANFCSGDYGGDGGLAIDASLHHPVGMVFDTLGNIFFADGENDRVRKIDITTGIITTVAGNGGGGYSGDGGPAFLAEISTPTDITFDKKGNLYIVDKTNCCIRKVTIDGVIHTIAGVGQTPGYNGDGGLADTSLLNEPYGIEVDKIGNVYVVDQVNYRIRKIDTFGIITTIAGTGIFGYNGDNISATTAQICTSNIALDEAENLYLADACNHRIRRIDKTTGIITTVAGIGTAGYSGDNNDATLAELNGPADITFDNNGNLYISDNTNKRIRKVTEVGEIDPSFVQKEIVSTKFTLAPNPATSHITITANTKIEQLHLNNAVGVTVRRADSESDKETIDISELPTGIYFLTVYDMQGNKRTEKVIKQ